MLLLFRTQNQQYKKHHTPVVDRTPLEPPPILIAVVGGPQAGKSSLMRSLIKIYTKQRLTSIAGPVTVVAGNSLLDFINVSYLQLISNSFIKMLKVVSTK